MVFVMFVKGYGTWLVTAILERLHKKMILQISHLLELGEYWDSNSSIINWLKESNVFTDNSVAAFDFALRRRLKDLCDTYSFSMRTLAQNGTLLTDGLSSVTVTFVKNRDLARTDPIVNDKMLSYAYILTLFRGFLNPQKLNCNWTPKYLYRRIPWNIIAGWIIAFDPKFFYRLFWL